MGILTKVRGTVLFFSLLYLTFYIPMTLLIYTPYWFEINCGWHGRCATIGYDKAHTGIEELNAFFLHTGELKSYWTNKETLHLTEVRWMFDRMAIVGLIFVVLLIVLFDKIRVRKFALINIAVVLSLLLVLPFFGTFWRDVFHPLLFDNNLWVNNRYDLSYYIMPRSFFKYTVALLVVLTVIINTVLRLVLRDSHKYQT